MVNHNVPETLKAEGLQKLIERTLLEMENNEGEFELEYYGLGVIIELLNKRYKNSINEQDRDKLFEKYIKIGNKKRYLGR